MRIIKLDGRRMDNRAAAWAHIKKALELPDYFGNNLDALADSISELSGVVIEFSYVTAAKNSLGAYGISLLGVLREEARSRPDFVLRESPH